MLLFSRSFVLIPLFVAFFFVALFFFSSISTIIFFKLNVLSQQLVIRFLESLTAQSIKRVKGRVSKKSFVQRVPFVFDHLKNYFVQKFGEVIETRSYKVRVLATKTVVETKT